MFSDLLTSEYEVPVSGNHLGLTKRNYRGTTTIRQSKKSEDLNFLEYGKNNKLLCYEVAESVSMS
uniref:Uncharacterized protein n=1 Tax=Arion vulgaris TaxID=1028688 RepID=A0A0B6Z7S5_9EUPU